MSSKCFETDFTDEELRHLTQVLEIDVTADPSKLREMIDEALKGKALKYYQDKLSTLKNESLAEFVFKHKAKDHKALEMLLSEGGYTGQKAAGIISLDTKMKVITSQAHKEMASLLEGMRPKMFGLFGGRKSEMDLVKELYGKSSGNADAEQYAKAWKKTAEMLRVRFNRAGGGVAKLETWALPQSHSVRKIQDAKFDQWFRDVDNLLDKKAYEKMPPETYKNTMKKIYTSLASDGTIKLQTKGPLKHLRKFGNRHQEHRLLHFKDAESWMQYHKQYGKSSRAIDAMEGYIEMMARDIAAVETFGPNPDGAFRLLANKVQKKAGNRSVTNGAQNMYDLALGKDFGGNVKAGDYGKIIRNLQNVKLHSAPLSAISDPVFMAITNAINGLPVIKPMLRYLKNLSTGSVGDRALATRFYLNADFVVNRAASLYRYSEATGFGLSAKIADASVRLTGLNHMTYSAKYAFGLEFLSYLGSMTTKPYKGLNKRLRASMKRYGIDDVDWEDMRKAIHEVKGVRYIDPSAMPREDLSMKVAGMINAETLYAVPESNLRVRAFLGGSRLPAGTIWGEIGRTATVFKTFPATIIMLHFARALNMEKQLSKTAYLASLIAGTYGMGLLSVQAKEIAAGRKPMESDSSKLKLMALKQTAGLDFMGELVLPHSGKADVAGFIGGPVAADASKLFTSAFVDTWKHFTDEKEKSLNERYGPGITRFMKGYEGITTPWYAKAYVQKKLWDQVDQMIDPNWDRRQINMERRYDREGRGERWID